MLLNKKISIWYFIREIRSEILFILVFAISIGLLDLLPIFRTISLPLNIPALLGTAVSLLLAFRTSQSYERWWEARTIWGAIVNDSRTFIRLIMQSLLPLLLFQNQQHFHSLLDEAFLVHEILLLLLFHAHGCLLFYGLPEKYNLFHLRW